MDHLDQARRLLELARARGVKIACAESCTGGLLAAALTEIPGSSDMFERGFITYSNAAKIELLGVDPATLAQYGAVSRQVARQMASGALERSDADIAVAITGIAGPGNSEYKSEGEVCFGLARTGMITASETVEFGAVGRANVRQFSVTQALTMLNNALC